jgi:DivIVA domain-containing protein
MALFVLLAALIIGAVVFGVAALMTGADPGLDSAEPDGAAAPLPLDRPLAESDFLRLRFDTALRGYRMAQVDVALRRAAYDIGYKEELIAVLEAEVSALRAGNTVEADGLREARLVALKGEQAPADGGPVSLVKENDSAEGKRSAKAAGDEAAPADGADAVAVTDEELVEIASGEEPVVAEDSSTAERPAVGVKESEAVSAGNSRRSRDLS